MEFRLTYDGLLLGASRNDPRPRHKHEVRRRFHLQLKRLWETNPYLRSGRPVSPLNPSGDYRGWDERIEHGTTLAEYLASQYVRNGYRFVPLVRKELSLLCSIDVLFLRPDRPGDVLRSGDIDNRIKTLFDALRLPTNSSEFGGYTEPQEGENPFFCLLEDDNLITHVAVETDTLLEPLGVGNDVNGARLVITVKVRPHVVNPGNINFG